MLSLQQPTTRCHLKKRCLNPFQTDSFSSKIFQKLIKIKSTIKLKPATACLIGSVIPTIQKNSVNKLKPIFLYYLESNVTTPEQIKEAEFRFSNITQKQSLENKLLLYKFIIKPISINFNFKISKGSSQKFCSGSYQKFSLVCVKRRQEI